MVEPFAAMAGVSGTALSRATLVLLRIRRVIPAGSDVDERIT